MHLIELELKACKKLKTLPKLIVQMQKTLKILELAYCMYIEIFPFFVEQPNIMKVLEIMLEFLINFEGLKKLSMSPFKANPNAMQYWSAKCLLVTFGQITKLKSLEMHKFSELERLPNLVEQLTTFEKLYLLD